MLLMRTKGTGINRIYPAFAVILFCAIGLGVFSLSPSPVSAVTQATYYVSPSGSDSNPGTLAQPFLTIDKARTVVRTINTSMTGDIIVNIRGGTYKLTNALTFNELDSGTNGYRVIYQAYQEEEPLISGGEQITGSWTQVSGTSIYKKSVSVDNFRQLYVNGKTAQRARSTARSLGNAWWDDPATDSNPVTAHNPTGADMDGVIVNDDIIGYYGNPSDVELHWIHQWMDFHFPVTAISAGATGTKIIKMKQPAFSWATTNITPYDMPPDYSKPFFIENAYELLDTPGEWYFNRSTDELFYWPLAGEDINNAEVFVPVQEKILLVKGSDKDHKVKNITFKGLTFAHGSWLRTADKGFFGWQAQWLYDGMNTATVTSANIELESAQYITFENNIIKQMGCVGISMYNAVRDVQIIGNVFKDLAEAAIATGREGHAFIDLPDEEVTKDNLIKNNVITRTGQDYWGSPAIMAFYVDGLQIIHNDISDVPYDGLSIGWGWAGTPTSTTARNNIVEYNKIYDYSTRAVDVGGIYTLGQQPDSKIRYNYFKDQNYTGNTIYFDAGSRYWETAYNVVDTPTGNNWIMMSNLDQDLNAHDNYTSVGRFLNQSPEPSPSPMPNLNNTITNTTIVPDKNWPSAALDIIKNAGLEPAYTHLLAHKDNLPTKNLKLWLKADSGVTQDGSHKVSSWADQSGSGNNAVQATAGNKPVWVDRVNDTPVIRFDGKDDFLEATGVTGTMDNFTVAFTIKPASMGNYNQNIGASGGSGQFVFHTDKYGGIYNGTTNDATAFEVYQMETNAWQQFTYVFTKVTSTTGTAKLYKNGTLIASGTQPVASSWTGFKLGRNDKDTINGDIGEVMIYSSALTDAERNHVETYMGNKYVTIPQQGLYTWLKADTGIIKDPGTGKVSVWGDQSGLLNNFEQTIDAKKPLLVADAVNGYPVVRFDGVDDYIKSNVMRWISENYTIIFAIKPNTTTNYNQGLGAVGDWGEYWFQTTASGGINTGTGPASTERIEPADGPGDGTMVPGKWQFFTYSHEYDYLNSDNQGLRWQGADLKGKSKLYKNGVLLATKLMPIGGYWNNGFMLGYDGSMYTIDGDIAEVIIYNKTLSDADVIKVNKYLQEKYLPHEPVSVIVDDTDTGMVYNGTWPLTNYSGLINDTYHSSNVTNHYFEYTFKGTSVSWITSRGSNRGVADIYIDGVFQTSIDTYSNVLTLQEAVYTKTGLPPGTHTIKVVVKGTKHASSTDYYVFADAFKYANDGLIDDTDPGVVYNGTWPLTSYPGLVNNSYHSSNVTNHYFEYTFKGTSVSWITSRGGNRGFADIYIDGVFQTSIDTYSNVLTLQEAVYTKSGLPFGTHTIKVVVKGTKNASSTGYYVFADAFKYSNDGLIDDTDPGMVYNGIWPLANYTGLINDTYHSNNVTNSFFEYTFKGTSVSWITARSSNRGMADVYIDGAYQATIDTYSSVLTMQEAMYTKTGLSPGTHTIKVVVKGTKHASSTGYYVFADAFQIGN